MPVIACETQQPPVFPPVVNNAVLADEQKTLNPSTMTKCRVAPASASTASDVASVDLRTAFHIDKIAVLFGERSTQKTKNQSRQRLRGDETISSAIAANQSNGC